MTFVQDYSFITGPDNNHHTTMSQCRGSQVEGPDNNHHTTMSQCHGSQVERQIQIQGSYQLAMYEH